MAKRALQPCLDKQCYTLTRLKGGYCEAHQHKLQWKRSSSQTTTQRGYGAKWRKLRARVLARDTYWCQVCDGRAASDVDHKLAKAQGGTDAMTNLQAICKPCHIAKTQQESRHGITRRA